MLSENPIFNGLLLVLKVDALLLVVLLVCAFLGFTWINFSFGRAKSKKISGGQPIEQFTEKKETPLSASHPATTVITSTTKSNLKMPTKEKKKSILEKIEQDLLKSGKYTKEDIENMKNDRGAR